MAIWPFFIKRLDFFALKLPTLADDYFEIIYASDN